MPATVMTSLERLALRKKADAVNSAFADLDNTLQNILENNANTGASFEDVLEALSDFDPLIKDCLRKGDGLRRSGPEHTG